MDFEQLDIEGLVLVKPTRIGDARGWFAETFRQETFSEMAGSVNFVQHNHSMSGPEATVRGLHFQTEPRSQGKLVRCLSGKILDVAVDLRRSSPSYGKHVAVELSEHNGYQLWVPAGFAHGFVTRAKDTEVFYLVTDYYSPEHERGLLWNDPVLAISWGVSESEAVLSDKDRRWPTLSSLRAFFA